MEDEGPCCSVVKLNGKHNGQLLICNFTFFLLLIFLLDYIFLYFFFSSSLGLLDDGAPGSSLPSQSWSLFLSHCLLWRLCFNMNANSVQGLIPLILTAISSTEIMKNYSSTQNYKYNYFDNCLFFDYTVI